jgi:hypothetical protein
VEPEKLLQEYMHSEMEALLMLVAEAEADTQMHHINLLVELAAVEQVLLIILHMLLLVLPILAVAVAVAVVAEQKLEQPVELV